MAKKTLDELFKAAGPPPGPGYGIVVEADGSAHWESESYDSPRAGEYDDPDAEDPEDEDLPGVATAPGRPVAVDLAYAPGQQADITLDEKILLANHKPLGAFRAERTPEGWRWVSRICRIGPKMELVTEYVMDNPGCSKSDAAWGAGLSMRTPYGCGPVERAISAGLITVDYANWRLCRLFACGFDRRAYYGEIPAAAPDGYWHPGHP